MNDAIFSAMVKSGGTIFVDLKEAKNGNKYLAITQSGKDQEGKPTRSTVRVFGDAIKEFANAINNAVEAAV